MAFPPDGLCLDLELPTPLDDVCFPGGICLSHVYDAIAKIPHAADLSMEFFSQLGPAMSPLKPFFDLLNTIIQIFNCLKAIPKAFFTLDPSELIECFPALAELIDSLLKLVPQLSIPKMVKSTLLAVASLLRGVASDLEYVQSQLQRIADEIDRAARLGNQQMNGFLVCAQHDNEQTLLSTTEALKGIGTFILLINVFMSMIGAPEIPCFGSLVSDGVDQGFDYVIDLLTDLAALLTDLANAIPDPDLALSLALSEQSC
jgi:hypothetical protein